MAVGKQGPWVDSNIGTRAGCVGSGFGAWMGCSNNWLWLDLAKRVVWQEGSFDMIVFEDVERSVVSGHYNSKISVLRLFRFEGFGRMVEGGYLEDMFGVVPAASQYWRGWDPLLSLYYLLLSYSFSS